MSSHAMAASSAPLAAPRRSKFFVWMYVVLLAAVFAGFAPTFFLRPLFDVPPIPAYLYLHGTIIACWYALGLVQAGLVSTGRTRFHRKLGWAGAVLAAAVVIECSIALAGQLRREHTSGIDADANFAWLVIGGIVVFTLFVAGAICFRRRPEIHKRLMLFASINIIGAALVRISNWPLFDADAPLAYVHAAEGNFFAGELLLISALIVHDLVSTKRVHAATVAGIALSVLSIVIPATIAQTALGLELIGAM